MRDWALGDLLRVRIRDMIYFLVGLLAFLAFPGFIAFVILDQLFVTSRSAALGDWHANREGRWDATRCDGSPPGHRSLYE